MIKFEWKEKILSIYRRYKFLKILSIIFLTMPLLFCVGLYVKKYNNTIKNILVQCEKNQEQNFYPHFIRLYYDDGSGFSDIQSRYYFFSYTGKTVLTARHIKNSKSIRIEIQPKSKEVSEYRMKIYYKGKLCNPNFLKNAVFYNAKINFLEDNTIILKYELQQEDSEFKNIVIDYKIDSSFAKNYILSQGISWYQYKYIIANYKSYFLLLGISFILFLLCFQKIQKLFYTILCTIVKILCKSLCTIYKILCKIEQYITSFFSWLVSFLPETELNISLKYQRILEIIILLAIELYFFRVCIFEQKMMWEVGDGRLNMIFMEHWFSVFRGLEYWNTIPCFYPVVNTMSFSDLMLGPALPYSLFRALGCSMQVSGHLAYILIHSLGSIILYYFLCSKLHCSKIWSMIGVVIFSCANAYQQKMIGHVQFISLSLLPIFLYFVYSFIKNIHNKRRILFAIGACLSYALLAYSGYYTVFYLTIYCFLLGLVILFYSLYRRKYISIYENKLEYFLYAILCLFLLIPFLQIYIPSAILFGKRPWNGVLPMCPRWFDFFNVGSNNYIESYFLSYFSLNNRPFAGELWMGFPIIVAICFIIFMKLLYKSIKHDQKDNINEKKIIFFLGIAVILSCILCCRIYDFTLWKIIYNYFPGASALRAVSRYLLFLHFPIAIIIAYAGSQFVGKNTIRNIIISLFLLVCIFINNVNISWHNQFIKDESQKMMTICTPPKDCKVFFIHTNPDKNSAINNLDAMEIASYFHISTINGYSGQFPKNWNLWHSMKDTKKYLQTVVDWMQINNMESIYSYDMITNTWKFHTIDDIIKE